MEYKFNQLEFGFMTRFSLPVVEITEAAQTIVQYHFITQSMTAPLPDPGHCYALEKFSPEELKTLKELLGTSESDKDKTKTTLEKKIPQAYNDTNSFKQLQFSSEEVKTLRQILSQNLRQDLVKKLPALLAGKHLYPEVETEKNNSANTDSSNQIANFHWIDLFRKKGETEAAKLRNATKILFMSEHIDHIVKIANDKRRKALANKFKKNNDCLEQLKDMRECVNSLSETPNFQKYAIYLSLQHNSKKSRFAFLSTYINEVNNTEEQKLFVIHLTLASYYINLSKLIDRKNQLDKKFAELEETLGEFTEENFLPFEQGINASLKTTSLTALEQKYFSKLKKAEQAYLANPEDNDIRKLYPQELRCYIYVLECQAKEYQADIEEILEYLDLDNLTARTAQKLETLEEEVSAFKRTTSLTDSRKASRLKINFLLCESQASLLKNKSPTESPTESLNESLLKRIENIKNSDEYRTIESCAKDRFLACLGENGETSKHQEALILNTYRDWAFIMSNISDQHRKHPTYVEAFTQWQFYTISLFEDLTFKVDTEILLSAARKRKEATSSNEKLRFDVATHLRLEWFIQKYGEEKLSVELLETHRQIEKDNQRSYFSSDFNPQSDFVNERDRQLSAHFDFLKKIEDTHLNLNTEILKIAHSFSSPIQTLPVSDIAFVFLETQRTLSILKNDFAKLQEPREEDESPEAEFIRALLEQKNKLEEAKANAQEALHHQLCHHLSTDSVTKKMQGEGLISKLLQKIKSTQLPKDPTTEYEYAYQAQDIQTLFRSAKEYQLTTPFNQSFAEVPVVFDGTSPQEFKPCLSKSDDNTPLRVALANPIPDRASSKELSELPIRMKVYTVQTTEKSYQSISLLIPDSEQEKITDKDKVLSTHVKHPEDSTGHKLFRINFVKQLGVICASLNQSLLDTKRIDEHIANPQVSALALNIEPWQTCIASIASAKSTLQAILAPSNGFFAKQSAAIPTSGFFGDGKSHSQALINHYKKILEAKQQWLTAIEDKLVNKIKQHLLQQLAEKQNNKNSNDNNRFNMSTFEALLKILKTLFETEDAIFYKITNDLADKIKEYLFYQIDQFLDKKQHLDIDCFISLRKIVSELDPAKASDIDEIIAAKFFNHVFENTEKYFRKNIYIPEKLWDVEPDFEENSLEIQQCLEDRNIITAFSTIHALINRDLSEKQILNADDIEQENRVTQNSFTESLQSLLRKKPRKLKDKIDRAINALTPGVDKLAPKTAETFSKRLFDLYENVAFNKRAARYFKKLAHAPHRSPGESPQTSFASFSKLVINESFSSVFSLTTSECEEHQSAFKFFEHILCVTTENNPYYTKDGKFDLVANKETELLEFNTEIYGKRPRPGILGDIIRFYLANETSFENIRTLFEGLDKFVKSDAFNGTYDFLSYEYESDINSDGDDSSFSNEDSESNEGATQETNSPIIPQFIIGPLIQAAKEHQINDESVASLLATYLYKRFKLTIETLSAKQTAKDTSTIEPQLNSDFFLLDYLRKLQSNFDFSEAIERIFTSSNDHQLDVLNLFARIVSKVGQDTQKYQLFSKILGLVLKKDITEDDETPIVAKALINQLFKSISDLSMKKALQEASGAKILESMKKPENQVNTKNKKLHEDLLQTFGTNEQRINYAISETKNIIETGVDITAATAEVEINKIMAFVSYNDHTNESIISYWEIIADLISQLPPPKLDKNNLIDNTKVRNYFRFVKAHSDENTTTDVRRIIIGNIFEEHAKTLDELCIDKPLNQVISDMHGYILCIIDGDIEHDLCQWILDELNNPERLTPSEHYFIFCFALNRGVLPSLYENITNEMRDKVFNHLYQSESVNLLDQLLKNRMVNLPKDITQADYITRSINAPFSPWSPVRQHLLQKQGDAANDAIRVQRLFWLQALLKSFLPQENLRRMHINNCHWLEEKFSFNPKNVLDHEKLKPLLSVESLNINETTHLISALNNFIENKNYLIIENDETNETNETKYPTIFFLQLYINIAKALVRKDEFKDRFPYIETCKHLILQKKFLEALREGTQDETGILAPLQQIRNETQSIDETDEKFECVKNIYLSLLMHIENLCRDISSMEDKENIDILLKVLNPTQQTILPKVIHEAFKQRIDALRDTLNKHRKKYSVKSISNELVEKLDTITKKSQEATCDLRHLSLSFAPDDLTFFLITATQKRKNALIDKATALINVLERYKEQTTTLINSLKAFRTLLLPIPEQESYRAYTIFTDDHEVLFSELLAEQTAKKQKQADILAKIDHYFLRCTKHFKSTQERDDFISDVDHLAENQLNDCAEEVLQRLSDISHDLDQPTPLRDNQQVDHPISEKLKFLTPNLIALSKKLNHSKLSEAIQSLQTTTYNFLKKTLRINANSIENEAKDCGYILLHFKILQAIGSQSEIDEIKIIIRKSLYPNYLQSVVYSNSPNQIIINFDLLETLFEATNILGVEALKEMRRAQNASAHSSYASSRARMFPSAKPNLCFQIECQKQWLMLSLLEQAESRYLGIFTKHQESNDTLKKHYGNFISRIKTPSITLTDIINEVNSLIADFERAFSIGATEQNILLLSDLKAFKKTLERYHLAISQATQQLSNDDDDSSLVDRTHQHQLEKECHIALLINDGYFQRAQHELATLSAGINDTKIHINVITAGFPEHAHSFPQTLNDLENAISVLAKEWVDEMCISLKTLLHDVVSLSADIINNNALTKPRTESDAKLKDDITLADAHNNRSITNPWTGYAKYKVLLRLQNYIEAALQKVENSLADPDITTSAFDEVSVFLQRVAGGDVLPKELGIETLLSQTNQQRNTTLGWSFISKITDKIENPGLTKNQGRFDEETSPFYTTLITKLYTKTKHFIEIWNNKLKTPTQDNCKNRIANAVSAINTSSHQDRNTPSNKTVSRMAL